VDRVSTTILLVASLALNAVLVGAAAAFVASRGGLGFLRARLAPAAAPTEDAPMPAHWRSRTEQHAMTPLEPGAIVFLGDSLTEWGDWPHLLGEPAVRNRGIAGDTVAGVLRRLDPILAARPRQVVLMIGINDLLGGASPEDVVAAQRTLLARLRAGAPEAGLVVQSLLPVDPHEVGVRHLPRIRAVNAGLEAAAREAGATWLDLYPLLGGDAGLERRYTHDGLHLSGEGYRAWAAAVKPLLQRPPAPGDVGL
jgi:lysophospholipase L1-like esterase